MAIASRLKWYLDSWRIPYEVISHSRATSVQQAAVAARVPAGRVAKCVLLEDERGYLLAVVPASCRVRLGELRRQLGRDLELATELEVAGLFRDCAIGAMPPIGEAYNLATVVDESLLRLPDLYFDAGDHEDLVHLSGMAFRALLRRAARGRFSRPCCLGPTH